LRLLAAALIVPAVAAAFACGSPMPSAAGEARIAGAAGATAVVPLVLDVVATYPHDPGAFTQGLLWHDGKLYESTGLNGRSSLREVEIATGRVLRRVELDPSQFGEGLALVGDRLFQLSYQNELAWEWDLATFTRRREFSYPGEGWGLTYDGTDLIQSDGSPRLTFRSVADFSPKRELLVLRAGKPQFYLNELEWVGGEIWSNIWMTDEIVRIDASSGAITGSLDASQLLTDDERRRADVLNGIAWDPDRRLFLITGKNWPKLFAVTIRPAAKSPA
jgi:glutaminyl-peptide cyclotransferase